MDREYRFAKLTYQTLRDEIVASQRLRSNVIRIKVTVVNLVLIVLVAITKNAGPIELLFVPVCLSIMLDFLINSYTVSIVRIGHYCKTQLEPVFRANSQLPEDILLWEQYMDSYKTFQKQLLSNAANLIFTGILLYITYILIGPDSAAGLSSVFMIVLIAIYAYDVFSTFWARKMTDDALNNKEWKII